MTDQPDVSFSVSPKDNLIVFSARGKHSTDLDKLDLIANKVTQVTDTPEDERYPSFSPDGASVIYARAESDIRRPAHIFTRRLDGSRIKQLTATKFYDFAPSYSPDGSQILLARARRLREYSRGGYTWDKMDVWRMGMNGERAIRITRQDYDQLQSPNFIPGAKTIVYSGSGSGSFRVYSVASEANAQPVALTRDARSFSPSVSPDGTRIVFVSDRARAFDYDLYIMATDGTNQVQITQNGAYNNRPVVRPSGTSVVFLSDHARNDRYELWEVGIDGRGMRRIADSSLFDDPLNWKPIGPP